MAATKFAESGTSATQGFEFWTATSGSPTSATDHINVGPRVIKFPTSSSYVQKNAVFADAGRRFSLWVYFVALPNATSTLCSLLQSNLSTVCVRIRLTSAGALELWDNSVQIGSDGSTLSTATWYHLCLSYTITDATTNHVALFKDGGVSADIDTSNNTLNTGTDSLLIGNISGNSALDMRVSDIYIDDGSAVDGTGKLWVEAKRPQSNGTTQQASVVGTPGSYGSGNARYVNERPLTTTNYLNATSSASTLTEQETLDTASQGDVDITGKTIVDVVGWFYSNVTGTFTETYYVAGTTYTQTTGGTGIKLFTVITAKTTYPTGNIGVQTPTSFLSYLWAEGGALIVYKVAAVTFMPPAPLVVPQAVKRGSLY